MNSPADNDSKARAIVEATMPDLWMLNELIVANDIPIQDVMRTLVLVANVKKVSQWGKVTILLKGGEIVTVQQEQQFVTTRELERLKK